MNQKVVGGLITLFGLAGCTSHLLFVEEDHVGLKAAFEANNPTPAELSIGYHRGIIAVIPQKSQAKDKLKSPNVSVTRTNSADDKGRVITVEADLNELMSLYTTFKANIGFNDPVQINHFLATGTAATSLLADHDQLRNLTDALKKSSTEKGGDK